jgi:2-amino-4-hydroxy-6-hydroxymethyldihydropteridine diphosphokinase
MQTCRAIEALGEAMPHDFVVGLGSNLGDREGFLTRGVTQIAALPGVQLCALSRVFETPPLGPPQPNYLNAAARIACAIDAHDLLRLLLAIETSLGRVRDVRWGPRVLDLDILWGSQRVATPQLSVPHRHLVERAFALAPLLDVAPELEPEYGAALVALGGAPVVHGRLANFVGTICCAGSAATVV